MIPSVIDLFCGVGGLSHGFFLEGFNISAGIDIDESCRFAFEHNNKSRFIAKNVEKIKSNELQSLYPEKTVRILVGCAPCQPFSTYAQQYVKKQKENPNDQKSDSRWKLLNKFSKFISDIQPEIISMENVPQLLEGTRYNVYKNFLTTLAENNYYIDAKVVYCPDYGIPQQRKRVVLLASKLGPIRLLPPTHSTESYATVRDAIGKLPKIKAGSVDDADPLHKASKLTEINLLRIKNSKQGGTWRDWDEELQLDCHQKDSGQTYASVYGRMSWEEPSPTITTQFYGYGNGRFGHPTQNRAISLREGALLQTFPPKYQFANRETKITFKKMGQYIGNAVPVLLARIIARSIQLHLDEYNKNEERKNTLS